MAAGEILERGLKSRVRWIEGSSEEVERERIVERRREWDGVNGALFTLGIGAWNSHFTRKGFWNLWCVCVCVGEHACPRLQMWRGSHSMCPDAHFVMFSSGGERWLDSSVMRASVSWMCHCKRNKVYLEPTHQRGSSGLVQRATEQGTESSPRDNRMHATQNLQLNSAVKLNRLDALAENFLQFFLIVYLSTRLCFFALPAAAYSCCMADHRQYLNAMKSAIIKATLMQDVLAEVAEKATELNPKEHCVQWTLHLPNTINRIQH